MEGNGENDAIEEAAAYTRCAENGLRVTGNADITALAVMFYIDEGNVNISGGADLDFTAPVTGPYAGVTIFQDRTNTSGLTVGGNAAMGSWGRSMLRRPPSPIRVRLQPASNFIVDRVATGWTTNTVINFVNNIQTEDSPSLKLVE